MRARLRVEFCLFLFFGASKPSRSSHSNEKPKWRQINLTKTCILSISFSSVFRCVRRRQKEDSMPTNKGSVFKSIQIKMDGKIQKITEKHNEDISRIYTWIYKRIFRLTKNFLLRLLGTNFEWRRKSQRRDGHFSIEIHIELFVSIIFGNL